MYTYQDFIKDTEQTSEAYAVKTAIERHCTTELYKTAKLADQYDRQRNPTINDYVRTIFNSMGAILVFWPGEFHGVTKSQT